MRLAYIHPGSVRTTKGRLELDDKTADGLREYARSWPGTITVIATQALDQKPLRQAALSEAPFEIILTHDVAQTLDELEPSVVLALHRADSGRIVSTGHPVVLTSENSTRERVAQQFAGTRSLFNRGRILLGATRQDAAFRRSARQARGIQANGFAAWNAYASENPRTLFFHDHRILTEDLEAARSADVWDGSRPLRIAFSGRLTAIKGPQYALHAARTLEERGAPVEVVFLGDGDLRPELEAGAPRNTHFLGMLDFKEQWKAYVRNNVDVMLLPHPQGDPSCTYFEALGSGAPVLGFANSTLAPLIERSHAGWSIGRGSEDGLVETVLTLIDNPTLVHAARLAGLDYMTGQDFESVARARVEHLLACAV